MSSGHNAIRTATSLIRAGFDVRTDLRRNRDGRLCPSRLVATSGLALIDAIHNGGSLTDLVCLHVQRRSEQADMMTDYFPGAFFGSVRAAISHAASINSRA